MINTHRSNNYFAHLISERRVLKTREQELGRVCEIKECAYRRAKEEFRDVSKILAEVKQQIGEVEEELFRTAEDEENYKH